MISSTAEIAQKSRKNPGNDFGRADILRYTFLKYTGEISTKVYSSIEVDTKVYLTSILRYTLI